MDNASAISVDYRLPVDLPNLLQKPIIGVHYFLQYDNRIYQLRKSGKMTAKTSALALSVLPLNLKYIQAGGMYSLQKFPVDLSTHYNFMIQLTLPVKRFEIRYIHISNGFGVLHDVNPGFDTLAVAYRF